MPTWRTYDNNRKEDLLSDPDGASPMPPGWLACKARSFLAIAFVVAFAAR